MKLVDRWLRDRRIARTRPYIRRGDVVLDVGCGDGEMLRQLSGFIGHGIGIEPTLDEPVRGPDFALLPGMFPESVPAGTRCDVITMLAVLEHMPPPVQERLADACDALLTPGGRIVVTVPSPRVDTILHLLLKLRLIEGMSVHEHYGFRPSHTPSLFPAPRYRLQLHRRFQLGLNNLFVFEKRDPARAGRGSD